MTLALHLHAIGHVPGARLVPLTKLLDASSDWDRNAEIVLVCRSADARRARRRSSRSGDSVIGAATRKRRRYTATVSADAIRLLALAIEDLGVACAVLDAELTIVAATPSADVLTDGALVRGVSIVKAMCGDAPQRPIAEALAAGRSASGAIVKPDASGVMRTLEVRASPIRRDGNRVGWLVVFSRPDELGAACSTACGRATRA